MSARMSPEAQSFVEAVFQRTDVTVGRAIEDDKLHRGTAVFVLNTLREEIERLDGKLGSHLKASHTERAVKADAVKAEGARVGYGA